MILDKIENVGFYIGIHENLKKGFEYLLNTDFSTLGTGKYDIEGKDIFALVSEFETKEPQDCKLEAHRNYADIQYIVSGREAIGYATLNNQEVLIPYTPERDIVFFTGETNHMILEKDMFVVFFPQDVHQPGIQVKGPEKVKKIVIKVKL